MNEYVIFGFSHFFGDIFDVIVSLDGQVSKVVLNVPEIPMHGRLTLRERLARIPYTIEVQNIDDFKPKPTPRLHREAYVIGFSRKIAAPLVAELKRRFDLFFVPMIHARVVLQHGAFVDEGSIVDAAAILGPWSKIGKFTIVNRGASVGHDCEIGDHCFISPSATLCSHVRLGTNVLVGANATILPDIVVGEDSVIAAGAVVRNDVPSGVMVAGVPAVIKREI